MHALVAVDLDEEDDEDLFPDVALLLERLQATVRVAFVDAARPSAVLEGAPQEVVALLDAELARREEAQHTRLDALLTRFPADRRAGSLVLHRRDSAEAIVEQAPGHDLFVVRTHGRRGVARLWLGSVAERIVRSSPVPVLVVRAPVSALAATGEARMLVAVDLDDRADDVAREAVRWALALRARVDALHVRRPVVLAPTDTVITAAWLEADRVAEEAAQRRLDDWLRGIPERLRGTARVERGEPAAAIGKAAEGALLVLLGTHGRRGAARVWLGSVAERVARTAPVPVLVTPLPP